MNRENTMSSSQQKLLQTDSVVEPFSSNTNLNTFWAYLCLVSDVNINPGTSTGEHNTDEIDEGQKVIEVESSIANHKLVEPDKKDAITATEKSISVSNKESKSSNLVIHSSYNSPRKLGLTKMKWLTEEQHGIPDSSSPSLSPTRSTTSSFSQDGTLEEKHGPFNEKCLSTILRLDREHNLFGLSSLIADMGLEQSWKPPKVDEKPVFFQSAIVQVCCSTTGCGKCSNCCRHKTNTALPASLKCGRCTSCNTCFSSPPCAVPTRSISRQSTCPVSNYPSKQSISPKCCNTVGFSLKLKRKPEFEPPVIELTPRSSCILHKPKAARKCHHIPPCAPPGQCGSYVMPCYWPSRPSAPCNDPSRCFHNPPCMPPRRSRASPTRETCPKETCEKSPDKECINSICMGKNKEFKKALTERYEGKKRKSK